MEVSFRNDLHTNSSVLNVMDIQAIPYLNAIYGSAFKENRMQHVDIDVSSFGYEIDITKLIAFIKRPKLEEFQKYLPICDYLGVTFNDLFKHLDITQYTSDLQIFLKYCRDGFDDSILDNLYTMTLVFDTERNPYFLDLAKWIHEICGHILDTQFKQFCIDCQEHVKFSKKYDHKICQEAFLRSPIEWTQIFDLENDISPFNEISIESPITSSPKWRTEKEIMEKLGELTGGFISKKFLKKNPNIIVSGGLISALFSMDEVNFQAYLDNESPDIDLFVSGKTFGDRYNCIYGFAEYLQALNDPEIKTTYYKSVVNIDLNVCKVPIQLICGNPRNVWELATSFDMTHVQIFLTYATGLVCTPACFLAHLYRVATYHSLLYVKISRIHKALKRGFSIESTTYFQRVVDRLGLEFIKDSDNAVYDKPEYEEVDFIGDTNYVVDYQNGLIQIDTDFHSMIEKRCYYDENSIQLYGDFSYEPSIEEGKILSYGDIFVFGYVTIKKQNEFGLWRLEIPEFKNLYMLDKIREYFDKTLKLLQQNHPNLKEYSVGIKPFTNVMLINGTHMNENHLYTRNGGFVYKVELLLKNFTIEDDLVNFYLSLL